MDFKQKKDQIEGIHEPSIEVAKKNEIEVHNRIIKDFEPSYEDYLVKVFKEVDKAFVVFDKNIVVEKMVDRIVTTIQNNVEIAI